MSQSAVENRKHSVKNAALGEAINPRDAFRRNAALGRKIINPTRGIPSGMLPQRENIFCREIILDGIGN
jgi:hypothetical protein